MPDIKPWKTLQSETILDTERYKVRKDVCQLPDGTIIQDYFVREQPDGVIIFCLTKENQVLLVHQYRHAVGRVTTEFPGGFVDRHDINTAEAARRELLEETGYSSEKMEEVAVLDVDVSASSAKLHVYAAINAERVTAPEFRSREQTETVLVSKEELVELVKSGTIQALNQIAVLHCVERYLGND
ncbi:MAG: NUDIX hydrolase [Patescibacteria group bacterium]|jgi:8-oxo-dGTP pyrophosphatase MutT (NUDIX family)